MGNTRSAAGCQFHDAPPARPTVRQAARRLLDALTQLHAGMEVNSFHGWENGHGEPAGDALEEARRELEILLAETPRLMQILTGADVDPAAFEKVWRSDAVQHAGQRLGHRGIAEAVWAAAFDQVRGTIGHTSKETDPCA